MILRIFVVGISFGMIASFVFEGNVPLWAHVLNGCACALIPIISPPKKKPYKIHMNSIPHLIKAHSDITNQIERLDHCLSQPSNFRIQLQHHREIGLKMLDTVNTRLIKLGVLMA